MSCCNRDRWESDETRDRQSLHDLGFVICGPVPGSQAFKPNSMVRESELFDAPAGGIGAGKPTARRRSAAAKLAAVACGSTADGREGRIGFAFSGGDSALLLALQPNVELSGRQQRGALDSERKMGRKALRSLAGAPRC